MGFSHAHMVFWTSAFHIDSVTYQPWSPTGHCQSQYTALLNDMTLFRDSYLHCALQSLLEKLSIKKKMPLFLCSRIARIDIVCRSPEFILANEMPTQWIKILKNETQYRCSFWQKTFKSFWPQDSVLECFMYGSTTFLEKGFTSGESFEKN